MVVAYVPFPLVTVMTFVNAGAPVHVECDGEYSFTVIVPTPGPLVTGSTSPDRVTSSLRVDEPMVAVAGCCEVWMPGVALVTVTGSAVQGLVATLLLASPE